MPSKGRVAWNKGIPIRASTSRGVSEANRRRQWSEESLLKMSKSLKGRKFSEEHKRKIGESHKGKSSWNKGKELTGEHKLRLSKSLKGRQFSLAWRRKISSSLKARWKGATPEQKAEWQSKARKGHIKPNTIELAVHRMLHKLCVTFESEARIGRFVVDILISAFNLIIECDGDYWHSLPGEAEKDKQRDTELKMYGIQSAQNS